MITEKFRGTVAHFCLFAEILLIVVTFITAQKEDTVIKVSSEQNIELDWYCNGEKISFPMSLSAQEGIPTEFTSVLPEYIPDDYCIEFLAVYSKCEVYVGDVCVNSYAAHSPTRYGRMVGNIRVITQLDKSYAGYPIRIVFTPYYSTHTDIDGIYVTDSGKRISSILMDNVVRFGTIISLFTIVLVGIGLAVYQRYVDNRENFIFFMDFSFFSFAIMLWILLSSDIPQFFTSANAAVSLGSFLCLATIGIPYLGFCSKIVVRGSEICRKAQLFGWILPLLNVIGYASGLYDPLEILTLSHIYIIFAAILSGVLAVINLKRNVEAKLLLLGTIVFTSAAVGGIILFSIAPSQGFAGNLVGLCMVVFVSILFILVLYRQAAYIRERKYRDAYEELAYSDMLTGLRSRKAFERHFDMLSKEIPQGSDIVLLLYGINNLKKINDEAGFSAGDKALCGVAECLEKTFHGQGEVFRLGGDEFAVVLVAPKKSPDKLLKEVDDNLDYLNRFGKLEISASGGWCLMPLEKKDSFMQDIYRFADQSMYAEKQRILNKR